MGKTTKSQWDRLLCLKGPEWSCCVLLTAGEPPWRIPDTVSNAHLPEPPRAVTHSGCSRQKSPSSRASETWAWPNPTVLWPRGTAVLRCCTQTSITDCAITGAPEKAGNKQPRGKCTSVPFRDSGQLWNIDSEHLRNSKSTKMSEMYLWHKLVRSVWRQF